MLNKRLKLNFALGVVALFAFIALIPVQAQSAALSYNGWELDGFFRNTTAAWLTSWDYAPNQEPLAICRNTFRLNLNGKISNTLRLKAEIQAVYEPEYGREENAGIPANNYNSFDWRELRLDWRPAMGHNIRIGHQIVNWGEALTGRVGNVVNSYDAQWDLGLTNLEDTQMPAWMIRGIHQFYNIGTSIEWIWAPYLSQSRYRHSRTLAWNTDVQVTGGADKDSVATGAGTERFSLYPDTRIYIPGTGKINRLLPAGSPILFPAFHQVIYGPSFYPEGTVPTPFSGVYRQRIAHSDLSDSRWGFKTSSTVMGAQTGVYFYRSHFSAWGTTTTKYDPETGDLIGNWNQVNYYGFYANKNFDFGVLRTDICYAPDYKATALDMTKYPTMITEVDKLKVQFGYNKDFMIRALNPYQTFGLTVEYIGEFLTGGDGKGDALYSWVSNEAIPNQLHQIAIALSTNYNFGMYAPGITLIHNDENCGMLQLAFDYNPDWMNRKWKFTLKYTNLYSNDTYDFVYGLLDEKDMIAIQTQFSFP